MSEPDGIRVGTILPTQAALDRGSEVVHAALTAAGDRPLLTALCGAPGSEDAQVTLVFVTCRRCQLAVTRYRRAGVLVDVTFEKGLRLRRHPGTYADLVAAATVK